MDKTNRELAIDLLTRLIDLECERNAMAAILATVTVGPDHRPLDWKSSVQGHCHQGEIVRDAIEYRYAAIKESLRSSSPDCPDALSLLLKVSVDRVWKATI
jgi:hypothetical protein